MRRTREVMKWLFAILFALSGSNHFLHTPFYVSIVPSYLPWPTALVYISGAAEIMLAVMLLFPRTERLAAWGMIALTIAVTPANVQMAIHPEMYPHFSPALLWARLPMQFVILGWAYWFTRPRR